MSNLDPFQMTILAARAKTKAKRKGHRGINDLSFDEVRALVFIADIVLADYVGPLTCGEPDLTPRNQTTELETA